MYHSAGDMEHGGGDVCVGDNEYVEESLYPSLNFAVNPQLL